MIYSNKPTIDGGETWAHIFVGLILRITDVFKVKNDSAVNVSLALFRIVFVCVVLLQRSLLMMFLFIVVDGTSYTSKICGSAFGNVKVNINIRTMLRIDIN